MENHQVEVVAAAAGTIISKHDGEYDRNCVGSGSGLVANDVIIQHADGSVALYWHMKDSITTKAVGQTVAAGEYLGIVGSSGSSSGAHLHFEVWAGTTASTLIDPFAGTCNLKNATSWWVSQKPHAEPQIVKASVHTTDIVTPACPTTETPNESTSYIQPFQGVGLAPGYAKFYAFVRNGISGQPVTMSILNPDMSVFNSWSYTLSASYNFGTLGFSKKLPVTAGTYTFNATYNGIPCTQSFDILTTLPVSLAWFKDEARQGYNQLFWQTLTENNNAYFSIEKSRDGISFSEVSKLKSAGATDHATNYSYADGNEINGLVYYRLKQVNLDGSSTYSNIVSLKNNKHSLFTLYPNPAQTFVQLQFDKPIAGKVNVEVEDVAGKVILTKTFAPNEVLTLSLNQLPAGSYAVKVLNDKEEYVQKLIVSK